MEIHDKMIIATPIAINQRYLLMLYTKLETCA